MEKRINKRKTMWRELQEKELFSKAQDYHYVIKSKLRQFQEFISEKID